MSDQPPIFDLTISLAKPIALGSLSYSELVLREPTAGEWLSFEKLPRIEGMTLAVATVAGVPLPAVQAMGARTIRKGITFLDALLYGDLPDSEIGSGDEWMMTLRHPLTFGDKTYSSLQLHEPTAAEWAKFDGLPGRAADIMALSVVSSVPELALHKIGARDLRRGASYLTPFLFDVPATGTAV